MPINLQNLSPSKLAAIAVLGGIAVLGFLCFGCCLGGRVLESLAQPDRQRSESRAAKTPLPADSLPPEDIWTLGITLEYPERNERAAQAEVEVPTLEAEPEVLGAATMNPFADAPAAPDGYLWRPDYTAGPVRFGGQYHIDGAGDLVPGGIYRVAKSLVLVPVHTDDLGAGNPQHRATMTGRLDSFVPVKVLLSRPTKANPENHWLWVEIADGRQKGNRAWVNGTMLLGADIQQLHPAGQ